MTFPLVAEDSFTRALIKFHMLSSLHSREVSSSIALIIIDTIGPIGVGSVPAYEQRLAKLTVEVAVNSGIQRLRLQGVVLGRKEEEYCQVGNIA